MIDRHKVAYRTQLEVKNAEFRSTYEKMKAHRINLEKTVVQIQSARAYRVWQKWVSLKTKIRNRIIHMINTVKDVLRAHLPYGTRQQLKKFLATFNTNQREFDTYKTYLNKPQREETVEPLAESISVIIPTKNAGSLFYAALKKIKQQQGVQEPELIILDSGSTDDTIKIAEDHGAKIISIKPEEFSHSAVRNRGAKEASGEYIVFTVQDAILLNEFTLYDMVSMLKESGAVAGTGRQVPRADSDFFASWQISQYIHMISPEQKDIVVSVSPQKFAAMPLGEKRSNCTIDDVLSIYKKSEFDEIGGYDEQYGYGEDLDMGKRLIEAGKKIVFLYSTGVVHSHNRPASYILKRYYTDSTFMYKVFEEKNLPELVPASNAKELVASVQQFVTEVAAATADKDVLAQVFATETLPAGASDIVSGFTVSEVVEGLAQELKVQADSKKDNVVAALRAQLEAMIRHAAPAIKEYYNTQTVSPEEQTALLDKLTSLIISSVFSAEVTRHGKEGDWGTIDRYLTANV